MFSPRKPLAAAMVFTLVGCGDAPAGPEPGPEVPGLEAVSVAALHAALAEWIDAVSVNAAALGPAQDASQGSNSVPAELLTASSAFITFPSNPVAINASAHTVVMGPCFDQTSGYSKWSMELSAADITNFDSALAAGGAVTAYGYSEHSGGGDGTSGYAEVLRVAHQGAAGSVTLVGTTSNAESPITGVTNVTLPVDIPSVTGWAAGDTLWLEQFATVVAFEGPGICATGSNQITQWNREPGAKVEY